MSGTKVTYARITQNEWNTAKRNLQEARNQNRNLENQIQQERQAALQREAELENRSKRELENMNQQFAQRLRIKEEEFNRRFAEQRNDNERSIEEMRNSFNEMLQVERLETRREIESAIASVQQDLQNQRLTERELAQYWINAYQEQLDGIRNERVHYDHLRPGYIGTCEEALENARMLLETVPSAALGNITAQLPSLTQFRMELVAYENVWTSVYNRLRERDIEITGQFDDAERRQYTYAGETIDANVNEYTNGSFNNSRESYNRLREELLTENALSIEDLERINESMNRFSQEVCEAEDTALNRVTEEQLLIDTLGVVADSLRESGWAFREATGVVDENNPERRGVSGYFVNIANNDELAFTYYNDGATEIDQNINGSRSENVTMLNANEIASSLRASGISVSPIQEDRSNRSANRGRAEVFARFNNRII